MELLEPRSNHQQDILSIGEKIIEDQEKVKVVTQNHLEKCLKNVNLKFSHEIFEEIYQKICSVDYYSLNKGQD